MKFRFVFLDILPCKIIVDRRFRGTCCFHHPGDESSTKDKSELHILIYSGGWGVKFMKHFKGAQSIKVWELVITYHFLCRLTGVTFNLT
jgi:hypothetical protein